MEYLEGVYYSIVDSNKFKLIRFFKSQKVIIISINGKFKGIHSVLEWFDLGKQETEIQYHIKGKNISFEKNVTIYLSTEDEEGKNGIIEYNGEILNKESISLNSYNHINKYESQGVIYKKYNGVEDEIEEGLEEDLEEEDFYDIVQTYATVKKEGKIIAEGKIHYAIFENEYLEDYETHDRQGEDDVLIMNGKRYQSAELEDDGYEIEWGESRELGIYDDLNEAYKYYEDYVKIEIDRQNY